MPLFAHELPSPRPGQAGWLLGNTRAQEAWLLDPSPLFLDAYDAVCDKAELKIAGVIYSRAARRAVTRPRTEAHDPMAWDHAQIDALDDGHDPICRHLRCMAIRPTSGWGEAPDALAVRVGSQVLELQTSERPGLNLFTLGALAFGMQFDGVNVPIGNDHFVLWARHDGAESSLAVNVASAVLPERPVVAPARRRRDLRR